MSRTSIDAAPLLARIDASRGDRAKEGPQWLQELRSRGRTRIEQLGLPTTKQEEWRTTNVAPIADAPFATPGAADDLPDGLPAEAGLDLGGPRLVFVDGRYAPRHSSGELPRNGVWVSSMGEALEKIPDRIRPLLCERAVDRSEAFLSLNTAYLGDGAVIIAGKGSRTDAPIHLVFVSTGPTVSHPRTLVVAEDGSSVRVVETYVGPAGVEYFTNAVTDVRAGDDARVDHYRLQMEGSSAFHIATCASRQGRNSLCALHNINLGGRLARHDVVSVLDGEGCECQLNGLYLTGDGQLVDNHTVLDHAKPHGDSRELYKGVLDGKSRAVFNGRIIVREDAQKTDAKQSNPNLLLSRGALAHTRPQLEIYADDVKCTHGATIGRVDEEAVFYLRSRGISDADARNLMIGAFAGEVLDRIEIDPLRSRLATTVADRLTQTARDSIDG